MRVAALGKSGSITALLKSLGVDGRRRPAPPKAPKIHALREAVTDAIAGRKAALEAAELERKLATETDRPVASGAGKRHAAPSTRSAR